MRIEEDMKLDYKDVLIRPKRSTLGSRKDVDLERGFTFRNYKGPRPMVARTSEPGHGFASVRSDRRRRWFHMAPPILPLGQALSVVCCISGRHERNDRERRGFWSKHTKSCVISLTSNLLLDIGSIGRKLLRRRNNE